MKIVCINIILLFVHAVGFAQYIQVNESGFTEQELIEDVLINNDCINDIQVTNVVGGNFNDGSKSYGFFDANGSGFPFDRGIVLSTGKLSNVPGPNSSLSDDDAPAWQGDSDLEFFTGINNTTNATIIEFDFIPTADNIRFRYLFASEEYQEGDPNTCRYSDAFAFLIRPLGGQYTNLALVPGTQTPVLVTTVHPEIPGGCPAINETYFESFNGVNVPINFNGQTTILTAESTVIPNEMYQIKLVLGDEENFRYDSAVFLEADSFTIGADLGPDQSFITNNPLCDEEQYILDATPTGNTPQGYTWFKNGILIAGETDAMLTVDSSGIYSVEIDYGAGCVAFDEVVIDYAAPFDLTNTELFQCEEMTNGIATYNLYDVAEIIMNGDSSLQIQGFYRSQVDAENGIDEIPNPGSYTNSMVDEIVYARVVSPVGCFEVGEITLKTTTNTLGPYTLIGCSENDNTEFAIFDLSEITERIIDEVGFTATVEFYFNYENAISRSNPLQIIFENTVPEMQTIYARIDSMEGCFGIAEIDLFVVKTPVFSGPLTYYYCIDTFPSKIEIESGVLGNIEDYTFEWDTLDTTPTLDINTPGIFTVTVSYTATVNGTSYSCSSENIITVLPSELPVIEEIVVAGNYGNQSITVSSEGAGDYEYSLYENSNYQDNNVFSNLLGGIYTVFVRDKNGCGVTTETVYVLDFPRFMTPNQDGFNDLWQIRGLDRQDLQITKIELFDRYGKLLKVLSPTSAGWSGTLNGKLLPSNDYWFTVYFTDGGTYQSHFTMKR